MEHSRKGAHWPQSLEQPRRNPNLTPELPDAVEDPRQGADDNKRRADCSGQIGPRGHREGESERVLDKTGGNGENKNREEGNTGIAAVVAVDWRRRSMTV
ncbi:hypothetical protein V6N13_071000 [Hibiscus sabdariffa]